MKRNLLVSIIVAIVLLGAAYVYVISRQTNMDNPLNPTNPTPTSTATQNQIIFPSGNETLMRGRTYQLQWTGGPNPTQIFLIDTALESQGTSVSITDRVYDIPNTGSHQYTIPEEITDGIYKFQIGDQTSNPFTITSSNQDNQLSFCNANDLEGTINLEGAAGTTYGKVTLLNTSDQTCKIIGNNLIQYTSDVTNLTTITQGQSNSPTFTLEPNQAMYSQIRYSNGAQCLSETESATITFTYQFAPNQTITFTDANNQTEINIAVCSATTEQTQIQVWSLSPNPITN